jgi:hypothetical protein
MKILRKGQIFENAIYHLSIGFRVALPEWEKDKIYLVFDKRCKKYVFKSSGKRVQRSLSISELNSHDWIIYKR